MERLENEDQFIKGAIAGIIAGVLMFFFVEIFRWAGLTKYGISYLAGDTVFTYKNNLGMNLISLAIHSGVGVFWGIIFAFLFTKVFTAKHYLIKILFCSFCVFFFHLGFLDEPFHYAREIHQKTLDLIIILLGYLVYGLVLAYGLKKQGIFHLNT